MSDAELDPPAPVEPLAVQDCHGLLKWMLPVIDRMPRGRRYSLGTRIENHLVAASYSRDKRGELMAANRELAIVRHLWRLCRELELVNVDRHAYGARLMRFRLALDRFRPEARGGFAGVWRSGPSPRSRSATAGASNSAATDGGRATRVTRHLASVFCRIGAETPSEYRSTPMHNAAVDYAGGLS